VLDTDTLPAKQRLILELLVDAGPLYGLELVERSAGGLKRGTVYVTLSRMEAKGYVTSEQETMPDGAIGLPRRRYRPTGRGEGALRAWNLYRQALRLEMQT
jgi:PadR family transcriptional regulator, regulatory protein PadR